jgi:hypothetical protein
MIGKTMLTAGASLLAIFVGEGAKSGSLDTQAKRAATIDGFKTALGLSYGSATVAIDLHFQKFELGGTQVVQASFQAPLAPQSLMMPPVAPQAPTPPMPPAWPSFVVCT